MLIWINLFGFLTMISSFCILRWIKKKSIDYWVNSSIKVPTAYYNEIEVLFLTNSNVSFLQFHLMHFIEYQWKRAKKCKCIDTFVFSFSQTTLVQYLVLLNPHWHELGKQEKCSSLAPPDWCQNSILRTVMRIWPLETEIPK